MKTQVIVAGQGGQGVLELGNNLCNYELLKGKHVAFTPSYGPESRGGKVKCYVITSDEIVDSPIVEAPDYLIVMNGASMDYAKLLKPGGRLLMNSSLISQESERKDVQVFKIPATEIAYNLRNLELEGISDTKISTNSVMLGAYLRFAGEEFDQEVAHRMFRRSLLGRKAKFEALNMQALISGYTAARDILRKTAKVQEKVVVKQ